MRQVLEGVELLRGIAPASLDGLAARAREVRLAPGEALFADGDVAREWYVVAAGRLESTRAVGGERVPFASHRPGGWMGIVPLMTGEPYYGTAVAAEPTTVLAFPADALWRLLDAEEVPRPRIAGTFVDATRAVEVAVRERDKLTALGGLAAGLAHELNNPAGAARRAAADLGGAVAASEAALARLGGSALAERLAARDLALADARPRDGLAASDLEEELGAWLEARGVAKAWELAGPLAEAGVEPAALARLGPHDAAEAGAASAWLAASLEVSGLLALLEDATRRVSELVDAVREFTLMDRAPVQHVDVRDGLERALAMLAGKVRDARVEVERDYAPDLPRIEAYGSALNQVWLNLLDNAVDAAGRGGGHVRLRARAEGDRVAVTVADDGPGVAPEIRHRVFEPFFTTKPAGQGTGLGLEVAWRVVVERHHGDLRLEDGDGPGTAFTARLPLRLGVGAG